MDERNNDFDFDFTPIGLAIKKSRTAQGMTREQLARIKSVLRFYNQIKYWSTKRQICKKISVPLFL